MSWNLYSAVKAGCNSPRAFIGVSLEQRSVFNVYTEEERQTSASERDILCLHAGHSIERRSQVS